MWLVLFQPSGYQRNEFTLLINSYHEKKTLHNKYLYIFIVLKLYSSIFSLMTQFTKTSKPLFLYVEK